MLCEIDKSPELKNIISVKAPFEFKNNDIYIKLNISKSRELVIFTIDSAAQISILKPTKLNKNEFVNAKEKITITGVAENSKLETLGTMESKLSVNGFNINHKFHIVNTGFRLKTDGILGVDFLKKFNAKIDFLNNELELQLIIDSRGNFQFMKINECSKKSFLSICHAEPCDNLNKQKRSSHESKQKNHDKSTIMITQCKNNSSFYELLPESYFNQDKFEKVTPHKVTVSNSCDLETNKEFNINSIGIEDEINDKKKRAKILIEKVKIDDENKQYRDEVKNLLNEFNKVFFIEGDIFIPTDVYQHRIRLKPDAHVVHIKQFRLPYADQIEIQKQVGGLSERGIVERSTSPYNTPAFLVKKPPSDDGKTTHRLVHDYRALNSTCFDQYFNLPLIDDVTNQLFGSKFFTVLDVRGAYNQVCLHKDSQELTAFSTKNGHYHYKSVPFGIQSGPVAWNFTANIILNEFLNKNTFCYVDDILVHSKDLKSHIDLLSRIFKRLIKHKIKLKIEKCSFFKPGARYLGFIFTKNGLMADERKIISVKKFPQPKNLKETQRFLGMCSFYRRFVPNFSKIASSLYKLCKKDVPFDWNDKCQMAFEQLKLSLCTPPVLAYPDMENGIFVLMCDASQIAAGAVLNIREGKEEKPVEYFSRSFNETQSKYHSNELEILALVWAVEWFRVYLYGRPIFYIYTDNNAVKFLFGSNHTKSRICRWRWALQEYNFEVIHKAGKANNVADALSRVPIENPHDEPSKTVFIVQTRSAVKSNRDEENVPNTNNLQQDYFVEEHNNLLIKTSGYDHIFYFLDHINCKMQNELQHKLKKKFDLSIVKSTELYNIDANRSLVVCKNTIISENQIWEMNQNLQLIGKFCEERKIENIAFNIAFNDSQSYFRFKSFIKNIFKPINVRVSIYLCKIIELTNVNEINDILNRYHLSPLGGHMSFERMLNNIKRHFSWHNMRSDIKKFTNDCTQCHKNKVNSRSKVPMQISFTATHAMQMISFDHCGRINPPTPRSNAYILILQCTFTKYCFAFPVPDVSADTTARTLVEHVFLLYGIPETIVSDCHASFTGEVFKKINKLLKIKHIFTSPYSPASNEIERKNRELGNYLRIFTENNPFDWELKIPYFVANQNSVVHSSTGFTPFELMFGRQFDIPNSLTKNTTPSYTYDDFADEFKSKLKVVWDQARENIMKRKEYNQSYYNEKNKVKKLNVEVGDKVYIKNNKKQYKFSNLYLGPYEVEKITGENSIMVRKGNKTFRVHKNNIKLAPAKQINTFQMELIRSRAKSI